MTTSSYTDRYVHATVRNVPEARRAEIGAELRASIDDMIEARVAAGESPDDAEQAVLVDLGNPDRLATRYADRTFHLIGPDSFFVWKRLLILLVAIVTPIVVAVVTIVGIAEGDGIGPIIGAAFGAALEVVIQISFWVTLVFAILERTGATMPADEWTPESLTAVPEPQPVGRGETIATVVFVGVAIAFFPWQHFRSWVETADGERLPLLNPELWSSWIPILIAVLVVEIVLAVAVYRVGRMTYGFATVTLLLGLAFAIPAIWLLRDERLINPDVVAHFSWLGDNLGQVTVWTIIVIVAVTVWEAGDAFVKAYRQRNLA